jgi:hypothetical protein
MDAWLCKRRMRGEADGEVVWFWHPEADAKSADDDQPTTVTKKPVAGKSTKEPVKTDRAGKAGIASANLW